MFEFEGRKVKLFSAYEILGFGREQAHLSSEVYVVVLSNKTNVFGFEVDDLPNEVELVARPLHESLGKIPFVSAVSLNEEGLPVLILDADDLIVYAEKFSERGLSSINEVFSETQKTKKSVLVVDDSATVRETQRKILESEGFDVDTAIDGVDGWNSFRLSKYDIIVSDVDMPRMTGFELVEKIRSINTKIPIVIVSYKDRTEDRARGRRRWCACFPQGTGAPSRRSRVSRGTKAVHLLHAERGIP
jgi:two-component system sensor histidine kinase and response regulator WspE